jgi:hypothetical protein
LTIAGSARAVIRTALLVACAALIAVPTARADWEQLQVPPGGIRELAAASRDSLIASPLSSPCCPTYNVTANRGSTWSSVQLGGFNIGAILGAAPDGSFRALVSHVGGGTLQEFRVFKVEATGAAEPLGPAISTDDGSFSNRIAALDDSGSAWVPAYDKGTGTWRVEIVAADGTSTSKVLPSTGAEGWYMRDTAFGPRAVPVGGPGLVPWIPRRGTYRLNAGGAFEPAESYPVDFADGDFWYSDSTERASWDAGAHWGEVSESARVVPRATGSARFLGMDDGVAVRYSPSLYSAAGSPYPAGVQLRGIVDAGDALVLHNEGVLYAEPLPLGPAPRTIGAVPGDSAAMIARADLFRADAGLPPLTGDAAISKAALNHSLYTALNQTDLAVSAHSETPGSPGFTGHGPGERCEAVGAECFGEVMYAPVPDPVGGWLATVFHRFLPGDPEMGLVGGGKAEGGWFVMDAGADRNVLIQPFGYPSGRWRGDEGFNGEIPDPVEICRQNGQPISYPAGIAVTLFLPEGAGRVERIVVRKRGNPTPLAGCLLAEGLSFVLDDPLERNQTYDVHAEWRTGSNLEADGTTTAGVTLSRDWSFYFQPDGYGRVKPKRPCRALALRTIKSVAPARRRGRPRQVLGIEEKVTLKQKAKVRLRWARLNYWTAGVRHSVRLELGKLRRRAVRVGRTSFLRFRLPRPVVPRVIPGEPAELQLKFTGRRASGCKHVVHIARLRKIEIGWVRVAGPAAWVSAKRLHRRGHRKHSPRG